MIITGNLSSYISADTTVKLRKLIANDIMIVKQDYSAVADVKGVQRSVITYTAHLFSVTEGAHRFQNVLYQGH